MSDPAAFTATFSDLKTIKTRSVVSFHFEVAIEQADQALSILGGLPKSGAEIHVAIARLQATDARAAPSEPEEATRKVDTTKSERAKASYRMSDDGERAVTRAAMLCGDQSFQEWMRLRRPPHEPVPEYWRTNDPARWVADWLRDDLVIRSRREIATDERAYRAFLDLEDAYREATGQRAELR